MATQQKIMLTGRAAAMLNYCKPDRYVLLGVGKTLPWPVEGTPPLIESSLYTIPELNFYVPAAVEYGLIRDDLGDIVLSNGTKYIKVDVLNAEEIVLADAFNILIKASIPHNLMPAGVGSYRAFGVYTNCSFVSEESLDSSIISVDQVQEATLDSVLYFSPVFKQLNAVEQVRIVRNFKNG